MLANKLPRIHLGVYSISILSNLINCGEIYDHTAWETLNRRTLANTTKRTIWVIVIYVSSGSINDSLHKLIPRQRILDLSLTEDDVPSLRAASNWKGWRPPRDSKLSVQNCHDAYKRYELCILTASLSKWVSAHLHKWRLRVASFGVEGNKNDGICSLA